MTPRNETAPTPSEDDEAVEIIARAAIPPRRIRGRGEMKRKVMRISAVYNNDGPHYAEDAERIANREIERLEHNETGFEAVSVQVCPPNEWKRELWVFITYKCEVTVDLNEPNVFAHDKVGISLIEQARIAARHAIYDGARGMIGQNRRFLEERVTNAILSVYHAATEQPSRVAELEAENARLREALNRYLRAR